MAPRSLISLLVGLWLLLPAAQAAGRPIQRGVSLGLFSEDPLWSYEGLLREIAALHADHVELVVAYYQRNGASHDIHEHPRFTAPRYTIVRTIRQARALGLKVLLFPILRLSHPRSDDEWRGTLRPADPAAWWRRYSALITDLAQLAASEGVDVLSVGSELSTLDTERGPWKDLVRSVRKVYRGQLTYSGNWDHYKKVAIYDLVDLAGVCGYFSLTGWGDRPPFQTERLTTRWRELREDLAEFVELVGRPLLFTELGYLSQTGAAAWPWAEGKKGPPDPEEQRRCYQAFAASWKDAPFLAGVYFWNWYGWGGPGSPGYTPRGKPAADAIREYFQAVRKTSAAPSR